MIDYLITDYGNQIIVLLTRITNLIWIVYLLMQQEFFPFRWSSPKVLDSLFYQPTISVLIWNHLCLQGVHSIHNRDVVWSDQRNRAFALLPNPIFSTISKRKSILKLFDIPFHKSGYHSFLYLNNTSWTIVFNSSRRPLKISSALKSRIKIVSFNFNRRVSEIMQVMMFNKFSDFFQSVSQHTMPFISEKRWRWETYFV